MIPLSSVDKIQEENTLVSFLRETLARVLPSLIYQLLLMTMSQEILTLQTIQMTIWLPCLQHMSILMTIHYHSKLNSMDGLEQHTLISMQHTWMRMDTGNTTMLSILSSLIPLQKQLVIHLMIWQMVWHFKQGKLSPKSLPSEHTNQTITNVLDSKYPTGMDLIISTTFMLQLTSSLNLMYKCTPMACTALTWLGIK